MDYDAAIARILSLADFERPKNDPTHSEYHLHRIRQMLVRVGNPHLAMPTIHVAGSKGKGSTSALIASLLSAQGYKAGLYTSPHLHSFTERMRIGSNVVSKQTFADLTEELWPVVQWVKDNGGYGEPTTFELLTCMAFVYFKQAQVDFQVVEVGMGGRLDTTNIVRPEVCVLTSISLDHTEILGDTLELIAAEKAGIIKSGAHVVVAPQPSEAMEVFERVCQEKACPLSSVGRSMSWHRLSHSYCGQRFEVHYLGKRREFWIPLLGDYQLENACTALAAIDALKARGHSMSSDRLEEGFEGVEWAGRMEVLEHKGRTFVVDGAHNPYSIYRLMEAVKSYFAFERVILLFGALDRHDVAGMTRELASVSPLVIPVKSRHPRSMSAEAIARQVAEEGLEMAGQFDVIRDATKCAMEMWKEGDLILGTGSLFVAAEVIEAVKGKEPEVYPSLDASSFSAVRSA